MSPARKIAQVETPEEGHPRTTFDLVGHEAVLARVAHAIRSGKPPQAWLITGPPGVGKATLAYRIARYLLRHGATAEGPADLSVPPDDPIARRVAAQAHPGLLELARRLNDRGKLTKFVDVGEIRKLDSYFGMTAGEGGWRIAIVDTADEMNESSSNALLKNLEEPPPLSLLMLLSDTPGRLLPTIRSRCQRLDLRPLDEETLAKELALRLPDADKKDRAALARFAGGSLGVALKLAGEGGLDLARQADALLESRHPDVPALIAFADRLYRLEDGLKDFGQLLTRALAERIRVRAASGENTQRWLDLLTRMNEMYEQAALLNLDPRQTVLSSAHAIAQTKRKAGRALMLVDSHCHLDFPELTADLDGVLARAREAGVGHFLTIGTTLAKFAAVRAAAEHAPDVHCTVGIHPHEAQVEPLHSPEILLREARHKKVIGFGESGLDYYYNRSPRDAQIANFRAHIAAARDAQLPLVVHTRDAEDDTIAILNEEHARGAFSGVIHCFTGTQRLAHAMLDIGFHISVSGIATFKRAEELRAAIATVPLDRLLVETDSPYLAPQPVRGKSNEPAYVVHTARMLAELKGVPFETLAAATTENFFRLFAKARA